MIGRIITKWRKNKLKKKFVSCGKSVYIPQNTRFEGYNIEIGNNVYFSSGSMFISSREPIRIGDNCMIGPNTDMISGDHRIDIVGKYMIDVTDEEKLPENDQPITLCGDNWIGASVTILKGVTIGEGAVIAAGALVTKDVPPYAIAVGVPAKVVKYRFDEETIAKHREMLKNR